MADIGNFLANMLLGGLSEGQKRRERQAALQDELVKSAGSEYFKQQFDPVAQARRMALSQIGTAYPDPQLRLSPQAPPEGAQELREEFERRKRDVTQQRISAILALTGHEQGSPTSIFAFNPSTGQLTPATGEGTPGGVVPPHSRVISTGQAGTTPQSDVESIVQGITEGTVPPDPFQVSYRDRTRVNAALARRGTDLSKLQSDWTAMRTTIKSANSTQQLRMRQALESVKQSVPILRQASEGFERLGFRPLTYVQLKAAMTGADPIHRDAATKYVTQINVMRDELAQGFMGGGVPTDRAFKLAEDILSPVFGGQQLTAALDQLETNIGVRLHAIQSTPPITLGGPISPQLQRFGGELSTGIQSTVPASAAQGKIRVRRKSDGRSGTINAEDFTAKKYDRL